jgi:hypothetical protein
MNIFLWVLQVLLALAFFAHGCLLVFPPASLVEQMNASMPRWFQLFLGVAEVLAAVGLTISATIFHLMRGEVSSALTTLVLLAMATYVAYMRWRVAPIRPRAVS